MSWCVAGAVLAAPGAVLLGLYPAHAAAWRDPIVAWR